jgi:hypothetical protein
LLVDVVVEKADDDHHDETDHDPNELALQVGVRVGPGLDQLFPRGRVDHHDTYEGEGEGAADKGEVDMTNDGEEPMALPPACHRGFAPGKCRGHARQGYRP